MKHGAATLRTTRDTSSAPLFPRTATPRGSVLPAQKVSFLSGSAIAGQQRGDVRSDLPAAQLAIMLECLYLGAILSASGSRGRPLKADSSSVVALNSLAG